MSGWGLLQCHGLCASGNRAPTNGLQQPRKACLPGILLLLLLCPQLICKQTTWRCYRGDM